jgi:hypothetical protein
MDSMYAKAIQTLYKGQDKKLADLKERLQDLRSEKDGDIVLRLPQDGKLVIRTIVSRNRTTRSARTRKTAL